MRSRIIPRECRGIRARGDIPRGTAIPRLPVREILAIPIPATRHPEPVISRRLLTSSHTIRRDISLSDTDRVTMHTARWAADSRFR